MKKPIHHPKRKQSNESGFTLLETSISMVLLTIAGLGVAACFFYAARNTSTARDRELSMAVAQEAMEQYRNTAFLDPSLNATATAGNTTTYTRGGRQYSVRTVITDSNVQNGTVRTKTFVVRVTPWSDAESLARNVQSLFGSVTIIATRTSQTVGPNRGL